MKNAGILGTTLLLILAFAFPSIPVHAGTGLTIQPVKISHTIDKGGSATGYISLSNASETAVKVELKVEDFVPNAGGDGVRFVSRAPGVTTVRDWITLFDGKTEMILEKGQQVSVPYTINAPADAEPGSHFGVAFFKAIDLADAEKQLKVGTQVGTLIFVTVPGNYQQKGQILDFTGPTFVQHPPITFRTTFENTGTVHFEPKGSVSIKNIFGSTVVEVPVEGQVVLPTGIKDLTTTLTTDDFMVGRYVASVNLVDGEGNALSSSEHVFYVFPLWYTLGFIVTLLVIFFGLRFLKSRIKVSVNLK